MGPMRDPMAGNGVQRWQSFDWKTGKKLDQTHEGESGQGLMEALAFHVQRQLFFPFASGNQNREAMRWEK